MRPPTPRTGVTVIGAGQAGLSVAYHLRRLGLAPGDEFVVLDRGPGPGGAWQHRWAALRIGLTHRIADLPGMAELGLSFDTADRQAPARDVVTDYYRRYEEYYGLRVVRPAEVHAVRRDGADLRVEYTDPAGEARDLVTATVVNATGTWGAPFVPYYPGRDDFRGIQLHTSGYPGAEALAGRRVVVVGGGTSAVGFLLELEGVAAELTWVTRRPVEWGALIGGPSGEGLDYLSADDADLEARRAAVARQDEAAQAGRALPSIVSGTGLPRTRRHERAIARGLLVAQPMFSRIEPDGVRWAPGARDDGVEWLAADAILWATGFRPELRHLAPLGLRETAGGVLVADGVSRREPRVFFAGYGPQASTIGANRAGRRIARQVVAALDRLRGDATT